MSSGELRGLVAFDSMVAAAADGGITAGDWAEQFRCPANIRYLRGGEPVIASRLQGVQPVVLKVRSSSETRQVTTGWQARDVHTGAAFNIRSVTPDQRGFYIDLLCDVGGPSNG